MTRLENVYREKVVPVLQKEFAYSSPMQIPGIVKISLNIGLGSASQNNKLMEEAMNELSVIAGQKAVKPAPRSPSPRSSCVKACPSVAA